MTKILGSSPENIEAHRRQEPLPQSERVHGTSAHLERGKRLRKWSQKSSNRLVSQRIYKMDGESLCELLAQYVQPGKVDPTLLVERGLLASPSASRKHNVRWEELNNMTIPLDRLIDHYMVDLKRLYHHQLRPGCK